MVTATIENIGTHPGSYAVQLYSEHANKETSVYRPKYELVAFAKVFLLPSERKDVELSIVERDVCGTWDEQEKRWKRWSGACDLVVADGVSAIAATGCARLTLTFCSSEGPLFETS
jgi:beta-glucosidase